MPISRGNQKVVSGWKLSAKSNQFAVFSHGEYLLFVFGIHKAEQTKISYFCVKSICMNNYWKVISGIFGFLLLVFFLWYFSNIVVYVLIAAVLSFLGQPLVRLFDRINIREFKMPHTASTLISLVIVFVAILLFFLFFVPVITKEARVISNIDFVHLGDKADDYIVNLEALLLEYNILSSDQTIENLVSQELENIVDMASVETIFKDVLGFAGSLFIGLFSVLFLTFFFLRDEHLFKNAVMSLVPTEYEKQGETILSDTRELLSRYFVGLAVELFSMMTLISLVLLVLGVKNALLIGFLGGMMNVVPYLGPIIGTMIGVVIGTTGVLSIDEYGDLFGTTIKIMGTFAVANMIDNFILQPLIYSNSVKAHPIEIFLVILMGGSIAGIPGMILAIPTYTVIRIIAKQFLGNVKIVQHLTKNI
jgi:predicted PurR-regulated permease PerM